MQKFMLACFAVIALASCHVMAVQYGKPGYKKQELLLPVAIQPGYGAKVAPAVPSILQYAPSNPSASSSAVSANSGLNTGHYKQLAVPSYLYVAGEVVNPAGGHGNIVRSYGSGY